jgi:impB/mucB/samB family
MQPLTLRSFARAIVHIDADAFFASCEQAVNPKLKGKPVVTGKERGIAAAVSADQTSPRHLARVAGDGRHTAGTR